MERQTLEKLIREAQNVPYQIIETEEGLREALEEFGQPVGFGNQWMVKVDTVRYSIRYADGSYTARVPYKKKSPFETLKFATTPDGDFDENGNLR